MERLPDVASEFEHGLLPSNEVSVKTSDDANSASSHAAASLVDDRRNLLFRLVGPAPVLDSEPVVDLLQHAQRIMDAMKLSAEEREDLERTTRDQLRCEKWHAEHVGWITASKAHRVMTAAHSCAPDKLIKEIMRYDDTRKVSRDDPREYGLRMEPLARQAYLQRKKEEGRNVSVAEGGLVVSEEHPFLATSTDGFVTEDGVSEKGVLEIKCPVTRKTLTDLAASRKKYFWWLAQVEASS